MEAVEIDRVFAPLDASDASMPAIEYAVAIAERYHADIHVLYVLSGPVARGVDTGDVDPETVVSDTREFMGDVEDLAADHDVETSHSTAFGFVSSELTHHPGSVILDTAEEIDADFIVVPREPVDGDPEAVLGKAAEYVLMYASQPVLSI
jgi:nucleotide-binding universal stress UspA family protein